MTDHLNDLRATINRLDDNILALVRRRMTLAGDIIAAKQGGVAYRPGREAAVIERLAAAAPDLPRQLVANVWRQLMTASTALQDNSLEVAVHAQAMAVAGWHFGGLVTIRECADLDAVRSQLDAGVGLALVPESCEAEMASWLLADTGYHLIASTPPYRSDSLPLTWMIGRDPADPVESEMTLVARQGDDGAVLDRMPGRIEAPVAGITDKHRVVGVIAAPPDQEQP
ncbi:MAG: chorismate mutase [Candidatus Puniceispirillaceae bacterium]|jgi:chorismate mutase